MAYSNEIWKDAVGYENYYQVSNLGNVRSKDRYVFNKNMITKRLIKGKQLVPAIYVGYYHVCFCIAGVIKQKNIKIHRLVAMAFLDNNLNKPCVNHKDGNRLNNHFSNLEWVTYSENTIHAIANGQMNPSENSYKKRIVINWQTGIFYSIKEASNLLELNYRTLINKLSNVSVNNTNFSYV